MAHILLIDDDELLRDAVVQMLELDRHRVTEAADGVDGLRQFGKGGYDLVITDVLMPRTDGAEVISQIRAVNPAVPIVAISGGRRVLSPEFNLQTAALAGATVQLAKPFSRQQLQVTVQQALSAG